MSSETALAIKEKQFDAPAMYGTREELKAIADRMKAMLPSARLQEWQLASKYRQKAEENLNNALYKAAQLCVFYRLMPGQDVHIIPFGNDFSVDVGVEAWKRAADRYASLHNITYHVIVRPMPLEELKERRGKDYDPEDRGAIAYVWRSDKAQVYELFGKEAMTTGYGVWRKKAQWDKNKNQWRPDPIQEHRTPQDVADRRALKMALTREFSLDALLAASPAEIQDSARQLQSELDHRERNRSTMMVDPSRNVRRGEDDILEWTDGNHQRSVQRSTGEIVDHEPEKEQEHQAQAQEAVDAALVPLPARPGVPAGADGYTVRDIEEAVEAELDQADR